jgi:hypothetical protein
MHIRIMVNGVPAWSENVPATPMEAKGCFRGSLVTANPTRQDPSNIKRSEERAARAKANERQRRYSARKKDAA